MTKWIAALRIERPKHPKGRSSFYIVRHVQAFFSKRYICLVLQEDLLQAFPSTTSWGYPFDSEESRWYSYLVSTAREWCSTAVEFLGYCYKAYMKRLRKMSTGSRKISK